MNSPNDIVRAFGLDASRIAPGLYQGAYPKRGEAPAAAGFNVLVLCAKELQDSSQFSGVLVLKCPLDDDFDKPVRDQTLRRVKHVASEVARLRAHGARVLVTCAKGWNRSGFVTALALGMLSGMSPAECVAHVQACRDRALRNPQFVKAIFQALG